MAIQHEKLFGYGIGSVTTMRPCDYTVGTTTLTIYGGIRRTQYGVITIPDRTINTPSNFSAFDDSSEAGSFASTAWRYFYAKISDTSKIAISTSSPYDKNGGSGNVGVIAGEDWVYIGAARWIASTNWIGARSGGARIDFVHETIGAGGYNAGGLGWVMGGTSGASSKTLTTTGIFGTFLPGASTNPKSRVARCAEFSGASSGQERYDAGGSANDALDMTIFGSYFRHATRRYLKTPAIDGGYYAQSASHIRESCNTLFGTDTVTVYAFVEPSINAGDGATRLETGVCFYEDQYIIV